MIDGIPITNLAPPTLIGIFFLLVVFGRLVPWWFYKDKVEECDRWRQAYEAERAARISTAQQTEKLVAITQEIHETIDTIFNGAELTRQGGRYVVPTKKK